MDEKQILKYIGIAFGIFLIVGGSFLDLTGIGDAIGIPADALGVLIVLASLGFL